MPLALTITTKGQVTLRRAVLDHLGTSVGEKVGVSFLPDGRIELSAAERSGGIGRLRGALHRRGQCAVTFDEMQEAIEDARRR
ncbi:MAG: AbrB/MazE/SpoVT family DNA-binding domain-containing protein [Acetobacteraceae bacterium]